MDGAGLLKRQDGSAQWVYYYTIHAYHCEIGLDALRVVSLKKARECATQVYLVWSVLFYMKGRDFIKESEKQKREAMRHLHYLKEHCFRCF